MYQMLDVRYRYDRSEISDISEVRMVLDICDSRITFASENHIVKSKLQIQNIQTIKPNHPEHFKLQSMSDICLPASIFHR